MSSTPHSPCPTSVNRDYTIDTAALPQGEHTVRILIEDASGNRTAVFGPVTRRIDASNTQIGPEPARRGALNGDKPTDDPRMTAHWGVRGRKSLLKSSFGRRHVISGRLTTALGEPISGATLDFVSKTTAVNARVLAKRGPQTTSDGGFSMVPPRGVSSRDPAGRQAAGDDGPRADGRLAALRRRAHRQPRALQPRLPLQAAGGRALPLPRAEPRRGRLSNISAVRKR